MSIVRATDRQARVSLPGAFANAMVDIEQVSDSELRIRKTSQCDPSDEGSFVEEMASSPLTDRDRDLFLSLLENPPAANDALRRALTS